MIFEFSALQKSNFHSAQVISQFVTRKQSFLQAVPIPKLDKGGASHSGFVLVTFLRAPGQIVRELIALEIECRSLRNHPTVQLLVGVFRIHQILELPRILGLLIVVNEILFQDRYPDQRRCYLSPQLCQLQFSGVLLKLPFLLAAIVPPWIETLLAS